MEMKSLEAPRSLLELSVQVSFEKGGKYTASETTRHNENKRKEKRKTSRDKMRADKTSKS